MMEKLEAWQRAHAEGNFPKNSQRQLILSQTRNIGLMTDSVPKMAGMEFTAIRDLKSGMKNLNVMFIVLDVGK